MKSAILAISASFLMVGCPPPKHPEPDGTNLIADMCAHLQEMGCEEGEDVYNDSLPGEVDVPNQSCLDYYTDLQKEDRYPVNPRCILTVNSCEEIEDARAKDPEDC